MIQKATFLGLSVTRRSRRRKLVVAYYLFLLLICAMGIWKQRMLPMAIVIQSLTIGGFFGGLRTEGLIKPYSEETLSPGGSTIQELHLNERPAFVPPQLLDEREVRQRDHAHYTAYRILRWALIPFFLLFVFGAGDGTDIGFAPDFFRRNLLDLLWVSCIVVLSLPQSVILWTEEDAMSKAGLTLVPGNA